MDLPLTLESPGVRLGRVPRSLAETTARGALWEVARESFLLDVPDVAHFLVEREEGVTIDAASGASERLIHVFLRSTPLAAFLYQRGLLALHASAVASSGRAVLLAGFAASGKSTLAAALLMRGWSLLADDLTPIACGPNGCPQALPTCSELALWPDSVARLNPPVSPDTATRRPGGAELFAWDQQFLGQPTPIAAIYWLGIGHEANLEGVRIDGANRFEALKDLTYHNRICQALFDLRSHMSQMSFLAQASVLFKVLRRRDSWVYDQLADQIDSRWR